MPCSGLRRSNRRSHKGIRSEEHTSELQSQFHLVCRLLLEKKKNKNNINYNELNNHIISIRVLLRLFHIYHLRPCTISSYRFLFCFFFFFNDTATTEIYTLSLHDALPISVGSFAVEHKLRMPKLAKKGINVVNGRN